MDKGYHSMKSSKKGIERFGAPLIVVLGAPTFMSAWVLLFDDKEPIHERYEWKRGIARRKARRKASSALERRHLCRHGFAKESIHEGCEWTISIARRKARRRASSAFNRCSGSADIYVGMGFVAR